MVQCTLSSPVVAAQLRAHYCYMLKELSTLVQVAEIWAVVLEILDLNPADKGVAFCLVILDSYLALEGSCY